MGTAAGASLRSSAGVQLVSLAVPLLASEDTPDPAGYGPASGSGQSEPSDDRGNDGGAPASGDEAVETGAPAAEAAGEPGTGNPGTDQTEAAAAAAAAAAEAEAAAAAEAEAAEAAARAATPVDDPAAAKAYAASALAQRGWEASQLSCLDTLWTKESEWLTSATNASSGAYGIAQSLPAEKMASAGTDWQTSYRTQINWGLDYISSRYGTPCSALNFHYANNWY
nr:hypothetical protein [Arthrobacter zhangbolii]